MSGEHWGHDIENRLNDIAGEVAQHAEDLTGRFTPAAMARLAVAFPRLHRANAMLREINLLLSDDNGDEEFCASFDKLLLPGPEDFDASATANVDQRAALAAKEIADAEGWENDVDLSAPTKIIKSYLSGVACDAVNEYAQLSRKDGTARIIELTAQIAQQLQTRLREQQAETERLRQVLARTNHTICQTLAQALGGYLWLKDDQVNFPGATEASGVLVVEETAADLAERAAARIKALESIGTMLGTYACEVELAAHALAVGDQTESYARQLRRNDMRAEIDAILLNRPVKRGHSATLVADGGA